jgi:hypothetical protein
MSLTIKKQTPLRAVLLTLLSLSAAISSVVRVISVKALVESSDVIVCGVVTAVKDQGKDSFYTPGGSLAGEKMRAELATDETLKGATASRVLYVEFFAPEAPSPIRPIPAGQRGIFFLQQQGVSGYRVSDPVYPFLPAGPGGAISGGSPLDRVTAKLGEALAYSGSTDAEVHAALDALATLDTELAAETLRKLLTTTSGELQLRIASKLVARNDIAGLDLVGNALLHPEVLSKYAAANLAGSLAGLKDPKSIPMLKQLLKTRDQQITRSVAIALRQSGSADALVPLSRLLDYSEEQVRYYAVVGMGEITRQDEWTPALDEFRTHESKYLAYWRDWAQSNLPSETPK